MKPHSDFVTMGTARVTKKSREAHLARSHDRLAYKQAKNKQSDGDEAVARLLQLLLQAAGLLLFGFEEPGQLLQFTRQ